MITTEPTVAAVSTRDTAPAAAPAICGASRSPETLPEVGGPAKIRPPHRQRLAVVYVRQSTPNQVIEHRESTALQYALQRRALEWGWPRERVLVIDQDQGRSGASAEGRLGFQHLLAEVGLDHVGLVLGIEMSRLARSCKDWYQLLELCALFGTLLADQDGLYDPREYNDRLLLGLKGTLSEAELHILRQRMNQGRLNKARRGELFNHPPMGYVRAPGGELRLDPDEQVQTVVRLIFQKFEEFGTVHAVLRYLVRHDIRLGIRPHYGPDRGTLQWRRPNRVTLTFLLHHPVYAGAYTWGRRPVDPRRKIAGRPGTGRTLPKAEDALVLIKDRCPAYIPWEQYQRNQTRMSHNSYRAQGRGPLRQGAALLKGLLVCGECGRRMHVSYSQQRLYRYTCMNRLSDYGEPPCQGLAGRPLDALITRQVLAVLEPASLELSLSASADIQRQREDLHRHWRQRLERAGFDRDRAARQYHAVEPENRLVARELERRWEQTLLEERMLQDDYDRFRREQPSELTDGDRKAIRALARQIPALWRSAETSSADRQSILRHLIERVVVTPQAAAERVDVTIQFAGGYTNHHELRRPVARYEQLHDFGTLMNRIQELAQQRQTAQQIAQHLNRDGWRPPKRRDTFNRGMVQQLLGRLDRRGPRPRGMSEDRLGPDEWWFTDLTRELRLPYATLYSWRRRGWIHARQLPGPQGRWIVWADAEELSRLRRLHHCPRDWANRAQAAALQTPKPRSVTG
ncbi:MAG TPA: recombinase family protein [Bryobacteraceae bacterium]|nr:recombinase family protein [Bryobacteraceae bacterium]